MFYRSVKIIAAFTKAPYWTYIFHSVHYDILKLWLTPTSAQFAFYVNFLLHVEANRKNT